MTSLSPDLAYNSCLEALKRQLLELMMAAAAYQVHSDCPPQLRQLVEATISHLEPAYLIPPLTGERFAN